MAGFSNDIMYADNVNFTGLPAPAGKLATVVSDGQLLIGSTVSPNIRVGTLTAGTGITITNGAGSITLAVNGAVVGETITGNTGGALSPTAGNWNIVGTGTNGIQTAGAGSTLTTRMQSPYADGNFSFESQAGGNTRTLTVQNTVDAASSQATQLIKVAGASSGDVWTQYSIGSTQSYSLGIDNSDSDIFKITQAASGTVNPSTATVLQQFDSSNTRCYFPIPSLALGGATQAVGSAVNLLLLNSSTTAASDAVLSLQVTAAGNGGNSYISYTGPTVGWANGVNKTGASEAWQIQYMTPAIFPNGTTYFSLSTAGALTLPSTPAFLAYLGSTDNNQTGDGTAYTLGTVTALTEIFDQGGNFNTNGTFTAPITGRYNFGSMVSIGNIGAGHTQGYISLATSNRSYFPTFNSPAACRGSTNGLSYTFNLLADMDAGDTAGGVTVQVTGSTKTISINSNGTSPNTAFWGNLEC